MGIKQNIVGREAEKKVEELFNKNGYWALNIPKSISGQPFDFVACKGSIFEPLVDAWFIDVKHIEDKISFDFKRIEPNQRTSMKFARAHSRLKKLGFVILTEREPSRFFYLTYDKLLKLEKEGLKSVKIYELENFEELI